MKNPCPYCKKEFCTCGDEYDDYIAEQERREFEAWEADQEYMDRFWVEAANDV